MACFNRGGICALALIILVALNIQVQQAPAADVSGGLMTASAMTPINPATNPAAGSLVEPAIVCYPSTPYVLRHNCLKACIRHGHHPVSYCKPRVPRCEACWDRFIRCATTKAKCAPCSAAYHACMAPLHF
jgi:hypothetical protein